MDWMRSSCLIEVMGRAKPGLPVGSGRKRPF
jgi:hypothetical protein